MSPDPMSLDPDAPDFPQRLAELQVSYSDDIQRRVREADTIRRAKNDARRRRGDDELQRVFAIQTFWALFAFLGPAFAMMIFGDEIDRSLRGAGAIAKTFTMIGPVAISMSIIFNLVIEVMVDRGHSRRMSRIYQGGSYEPKRRSDRIFTLIQLCRAGSVTMPTALIWIFGGPLDRTFSGVDGGLRVLIAIAVVVASWAVVRFRIVPHLQRTYWEPALDQDIAEQGAKWEAERGARDAETT